MSLAFSISAAHGQEREDAETAFALKLEKTANVRIDYEGETRMWISLKGERHAFENERECLQFITNSVMNRDLVVILFEPSIRVDAKTMHATADRLQDKLVKMGFAQVVFELGSAMGRPIYRIYWNDVR